MSADAHMSVDDFLGSNDATALRQAADRAFARHRVSHAPVPEVDFGSSYDRLVERLRQLTPILRTEFGLDHFVTGGIVATVSRHQPGGIRHDLHPAGTAHGSPQLAFVYTTMDRPGDVTGGRVRLLDGHGTDGPVWYEIPPADDQLLVFRADRYHEIAALDGPSDSGRISVSGLVTGSPLDHIPALAPDLQHRLQQRLLPRLTDHGFEVHPTPPAVHDYLTGMLELRHERMRTEPSESYRPTGDADYVDLGDLGDDVLRWLQPIHERFAGIPLTPSNVYGARIYRGGNTLTMHVDRLDVLVVSSVLQLAQDVDEPWPIVIERDGERAEVTLEPGEMLLYEGATCAHGRPATLQGRSFTNLFAHYRPTNWRWDLATLTRTGIVDGLIDVFGRAQPPLTGSPDG